MSDIVRENSMVSPRVSVVIVTYRSADEIRDCIESLLQQMISVEIYIVDNASPDETPSVVTELSHQFSNVHAILNSQNIGLAAGNNCILGKASGEYVLILNPDTILRSDTLAKLVAFLDEHKDVGVVGPKSVYQDGSAHRSFHRNWGLAHVMLWRILPYKINRWFYDRYTSYEEQDVLLISGACLLIRRSIFESIGGYDPEYFLTIEDVADLCLRVKATNARVVFYPGAEVMHYAARSAAQVPYLVVWQSQRGSIYHFRKHKGLLPALFVTFLLISAALARVVVEGLLGIFSKRYRKSVGPYVKVLASLIVRNPIWTRVKPE